MERVEEEKVDLGERIRRARKAKGMTQEELGEKLGVVKSNVARYEMGKLEVTYTMLIRIADALEIPLIDLVSNVCETEHNTRLEPIVESESTEALACAKNCEEKESKQVYQRVEAFSNRLRSAVKASGKSRSELCEEVGISEPALSNYLNKKHMPKKELMAKLAEVLNVSEAWLNGYDCDVTMGSDELLRNHAIKAKEEILNILFRMSSDSEFLGVITAISELDREKLLSLRDFIKVFDK